ncbi:hypothetical protein, partial [Salmonella sp. gx-f7]|uniref:hypothetical protein n=1 Tax=Salmonella sp. gx-f7 TaxID=2582606 RepID=UPI001F22B67F
LFIFASIGKTGTQHLTSTVYKSYFGNIFNWISGWLMNVSPNFYLLFSSILISESNIWMCGC